MSILLLGSVIIVMPAYAAGSVNNSTQTSAGKLADKAAH
jgi:hypothetical protein